MSRRIKEKTKKEFEENDDTDDEEEERNFELEKYQDAAIDKYRKMNGGPTGMPECGKGPYSNLTCSMITTINKDNNLSNEEKWEEIGVSCQEDYDKELDRCSIKKKGKKKKTRKKKTKKKANVECDEWCECEKEVTCKNELIEKLKEANAIGEKEKNNGEWDNELVNEQFKNIMGFYKEEGDDGNDTLDKLVENTCDMNVALSMKKKISGKENRGGRRKTRRKSRKKKRKSRKKRRKSRRKRKKRRTRRRRR